MEIKQTRDIVNEYDKLVMLQQCNLQIVQNKKWVAVEDVIKELEGIEDSKYHSARLAYLIDSLSNENKKEE